MTYPRTELTRSTTPRPRARKGRLVAGGSAALISMLAVSAVFAVEGKGCVVTPFHGTAVRFASNAPSLNVQFQGATNDNAVRVTVSAARVTNTPGQLAALTELGSIPADTTNHTFSGTVTLPRAMWPEDDVLGFVVKEVLANGTKQQLDTHTSQNIATNHGIVGLADQPESNQFPGNALNTQGLNPFLAFPNQPPTAFLSRRNEGNSRDYYTAILGHSNLDAFFNNLINPGLQAFAVYNNEGDLGLGRLMFCSTPTIVAGLPISIACSVTNYPNAEDALVDRNRAATVTMNISLRPGLTAEPRFNVYGADKRRIGRVALDGGGEKEVPSLCLNCHGGTFVTDPNSSRFNKTSLARFLPFDLNGFSIPNAVTAQLGDQGPLFRQLNRLVFLTEYLRYVYREPGTELGDTFENIPLMELLLGWYQASGGLFTEGSSFETEYVSPGWSGNPALYTRVFAPYCQSCHIAQPERLPFSTLDSFMAAKPLIQARLCSKQAPIMPHAQRTYHRFWAGGASAALAVDLGITSCAFKSF